MMSWYKEKDPNAKALLDSVGGNHLMTSHGIQLQLCQAYAEETTKAIIDDIGDRKFSLLVDELALILPVATASVEKAFSAMSIIKTEWRDKMGDERLNYSMVCNIEREIFANIDDDAIIYRFQSYRCRKGTLPCRTSVGSSSTIDQVMEYTDEASH